MSDSDIDRAVKEAAEFEAQDKKRKEAIECKKRCRCNDLPDRESTFRSWR